MARKRQEIALQVSIETQEEWEENLSKEGLTVCDIYQEWCGPCKAVVSKLRGIKNEIGDDLLHFCIAKADTVDSLERYRGKCEPCFLFYAGGSLVQVIRGCNIPIISRAILEQLAIEHKVLEGECERKEIKDPLLPDIEEKKGDDEDSDEDDEDEEGISHKGERVIFESLPELAEDLEPKEVQKGITLAILKPNVVEDGKVEEIVTELTDKGLEILVNQQVTLTEEQAREFYNHKSEEPYFEDLINFMVSGPSHILVLSKGETGEGIVEEWRDLIGPATVEDAKEQAPDSLRARYGRDTYANALHGSDSQETALRELAFFLPDYTVPTVKTTETSKPKVQRTLALIRPDALSAKRDEILGKIEEAGFKVAMQKEITLSKEQVEEFYSEHKDEAYYEELTTRMSSGPLLALALAREDAVTGWRDILGPKEVEQAKEEQPESLRAQFSIEDVPINQLHGSDSEETAQKELNYFFPVQQTIAVVKPDAYQTKDEIMKRVREAGFHIAARRETKLTKEMAEQLYDKNRESDYFGDLVEHMTSGTTLFMILSREDAVDGWRSMIGPVDPVAGKENAPESLRATYGTDKKSNAVHGSSDADHARKEIKLVFGDVQFGEDGTVKNKEDVIAQSARSSGEKDEDEESTDEEKEEAEEGDGEQQEGEGQQQEGEGQQQEGEGQQQEGEGQQEEGQQQEGEGQQQEGEDQQQEGEGQQQEGEGEQQEGEGQQQEGEGQQQEGEGQQQEGEGQQQEGEGEAQQAEGEEGEGQTAEGDEGKEEQQQEEGAGADEGEGQQQEGEGQQQEGEGQPEQATEGDAQKAEGAAGDEGTGDTQQEETTAPQGTASPAAPSPSPSRQSRAASQPALGGSKVSVRSSASKASDAPSQASRKSAASHKSTASRKSVDSSKSQASKRSSTSKRPSIKSSDSKPPPSPAASGGAKSRASSVRSTNSKSSLKSTNNRSAGSKASLQSGDQQPAEAAKEEETEQQQQEEGEKEAEEQTPPPAEPAEEQQQETPADAPEGGEQQQEEQAQDDAAPADEGQAKEGE